MNNDVNEANVQAIQKTLEDTVEREGRGPKRVMMFSAVTNVSRARRLAKALIGPNARVWVRTVDDVQVTGPSLSARLDGETAPEAFAFPVSMIEVGTEIGGEKEVYGAGRTFEEAFNEVVEDFSADDILKMAGPELKAIFTADMRRKPQLAWAYSE